MTVSEKYSKAKDSINRTLGDLDSLAQEVNSLRSQFADKIEKTVEVSRFANFDETKLQEFFDEPYCIIPKRQDEWYVIAPKFINFNIGWLEKSTRSYNLFVVNKYMKWLADVPKSIQDKFKFKEELPLKVFDDHVLTGEKHQEETWNRYSKHLNNRVGKDKIRIKQGHEFQLLAEMINDGILPFIPKPLAAEDSREPIVTFELRPYQFKAWNKFTEYGAAGIYWAYSAGKTFFGMYACASIKGQKLIVVPTTTLKEQWEERIKKYCPELCSTHSINGTAVTQVNPNEITIITYNSFDKVRNKEWALIVFDECHRLPANTFSRLATLKTKYRIGLSATPYREDGRTDSIFALTGFPVGLDWNELIELGVLELPDVYVYILPTLSAKERKLAELLQIEKKTLIFCDSIDLGQRISKQHGIPFIYGETKNRMNILRESITTVVSRVGDEGVSLQDLERTIEIDFQFGSRRQEGQRVGRNLHSEKKTEHIVLMTDLEMEKYEKRLYALYEKGFKVNVVRG